MKIKDLQTGEVHEYGTNCHDSLYVSQDGRTLTYYNLQNGDGSGVGDYRFVCDDEKVPAESETADAIHCEVYFNIGGWNHRRSQDNKPGDIISRENFRNQLADCKYFKSSFQKMTVAEFLTIVLDLIDNEPTVPLPDFKDGYKQAIIDGRPQGDLISIEEVLKSIEKQYTEHNELVPSWLHIGHIKSEEEPRQVQTPSCLTDPDRHAELLERYKEGGAE